MKPYQHSAHRIAPYLEGLASRDVPALLGVGFGIDRLLAPLMPDTSLTPTASAANQSPTLAASLGDDLLGLNVDLGLGSSLTSGLLSLLEEPIQLVTNSVHSLIGLDISLTSQPQSNASESGFDIIVTLPGIDLGIDIGIGEESSPSNPPPPIQVPLPATPPTVPTSPPLTPPISPPAPPPAVVPPPPVAPDLGSNPPTDSPSIPVVPPVTSLSPPTTLPPRSDSSTPSTPAITATDDHVIPRPDAIAATPHVSGVSQTSITTPSVPNADERSESLVSSTPNSSPKAPTATQFSQLFFTFVDSLTDADAINVANFVISVGDVFSPESIAAVSIDFPPDAVNETGELRGDVVSAGDSLNLSSDEPGIAAGTLALLNTDTANLPTPESSSTEEDPLAIPQPMIDLLDRLLPMDSASLSADVDRLIAGLGQIVPEEARSLLSYWWVCTGVAAAGLYGHRYRTNLRRLLSRSIVDPETWTAS